jgi:hypothetical protein
MCLEKDPTLLININPQIDYPISITTFGAGFSAIPIWTKDQKTNICSFTVALTVTRGTLTGDLTFIFSVDHHPIGEILLPTAQTSNSLIITSDHFQNTSSCSQGLFAAVTSSITQTGTSGIVTVSSLSAVGTVCCCKSRSNNNSNCKNKDKDNICSSSKHSSASGSNNGFTYAR